VLAADGPARKTVMPRVSYQLDTVAGGTRSRGLMIRRFMR